MNSRREFVKKSLLACASAAVAADRTAAAPAPGPGKSASVPSAVKPSKAPWPLLPYGSGEAIYLSDLDRCQPSSALSQEWLPHHWKRFNFVADKIRGVLLAAGQSTGVPDLEYPLTQKGWHAIYFGITCVRWESHLQVRLKSDKTFSILVPNNLAKAHVGWSDLQWSQHRYDHTGQEQFEDLFWKYAHLDGSGESIVLGQLKVQVLPGDPDARGNIFHPCWLGYIKLVPLSEPEVRALQADRRRRDTRRLYTSDDGWTAQAFLHFQSAADVRRQIEPYRDTDFSRMYWEAGAGDLTFYPSKVGRLRTEAWQKEQYRIIDELAGRTYLDLQAKGIDPFRVALDHCHEIGMEFHACYRPAGFEFPPPGEEMSKGGFYERHPEWRCLDAQGEVLPRLSYAFAEVRQYVISLFREMLTYPVDGLAILYNRSLPLVGYETPLVTSFKERYGADPRTLDERDPRWLAHCAAILTGFMREVRSMAREEERKQGRKPIEITAVVLGSGGDNYTQGVDLRTWVKEGLIDTLIPYTSSATGNGPDEKSPDTPLMANGVETETTMSWSDPRAAEFFVKLTKGTSCKLALGLMPRWISAEDYKRMAHKLYEAGVDNFFTWDGTMRNNFDRSWTTLARLGHKEELADWVARGSPPVEWPRQKIKRLGGWDYRIRSPG